MPTIIAISVVSVLLFLILLLQLYLFRQSSKQNARLSQTLTQFSSDTPGALGHLVKHLNTFNSTFADNTTYLQQTLHHLDHAYKTQTQALQSIKDLDVMKMADANIQVLQQLQQCTEQIDQFRHYLTSVNDYTHALQDYTDKFEAESQRLHILEEIRDYLVRHRGEIAKDIADADNALRASLEALKQTSQANISEFNKQLLEQSETFRNFLRDEQESFDLLANDMRTLFANEAQQMPLMQRNLQQIADIPAALDKLAAKIDKAHSALVINLTQALRANASTLAAAQSHSSASVQSAMPASVKYTIIIGVITIALATLANTAYNILNPHSITTELPAEELLLPDTLGITYP